jgi:SsrA-binding protein
MARPKEPADRKVVCRNRKAFHDYFIEDRLEAGLVLLGSEVKSLREGRASLKDAYATIEDGEAYILHMRISEWPQAANFNHDPERPRKLLLHAQQIRRLGIQIHQRGYTLVALSVYFNEKNRAKIELGLARGKRKYDKRETIREREEKREADRGRRR